MAWGTLQLLCPHSASQSVSLIDQHGIAVISVQVYTISGLLFNGSMLSLSLQFCVFARPEVVTIWLIMSPGLFRGASLFGNRH